jgi:hypothetical protein
VKFLDMVRRAEELQVLYTLHRRTLVAQAQTEALLSVAKETNEKQQVAALEGQIALNKQRLDAIGTVVHRTIGAFGEDELLAVVDQLNSLMETHSKMRFELARLKAEVELGAMTGRLTADNRVTAEQAMNELRAELEAISTKVDTLFPKPSLVLT